MTTDVIKQIRKATRRKFTANPSGLPVVTGPAEANSLGNIMVHAMARSKIQSLAEIRRILRNSF